MYMTGISSLGRCRHRRKVRASQAPHVERLPNHPDYDAFWKRQGFAPWLNKVNVPMLNVAGWWDQEDFYGPIKIYELLEKHDSANQNFWLLDRGITADGREARAGNSDRSISAALRPNITEGHHDAVPYILSERERQP